MLVMKLNSYKHTRRSIALLAIGLCASSYALFVTDTGELFVKANADLTYDSNIFMANKATSDSLVCVTPALSYQSKADSLLTETFNAGEAFNRYSKHSGLNDALTSLDGNLGYENGKTSLSATASYSELAQNSVDTRLIDSLVRRNVTQATVKSYFELNSFTAVAFAPNFDNNTFKIKSFQSYKTTELPIDFYYIYNPKLDLGLGYLHRQTSVAVGNNSTKDNLIYFAAKGEFTPDIKGYLKVGFDHRTVNAGQSSTTPGVDSLLTYDFSQKTQFNLHLSNDYSVDGFGASQKVMSIALGADSKLNANLSLGFTTSYRKSNYFTGSTQGNDTHYYENEIHTTYAVSRNFNCKAAVVHRNYTSVKLSSSNFNGTGITLGISYRY